MASRRSAPASVHTVAVLQYLGGAVTLALAGFYIYVAVSLDPNRHDPFEIVDNGTVAGFMLVMAAGFAVAGLAALGLGLMLQRGHKWAFVLLVMLNLLTVVVVVVTEILALSQEPNHLLALLVPLLCLGLLNTPGARRWFQAAA